MRIWSVSNGTFKGPIRMWAVKSRHTEKVVSRSKLNVGTLDMVATAMSMATENTVEFHTDTLRRDTHTVNKVNRNVQAKTYAKSSSYVCWRCAKPNHSPDVCRFKEAVCHGCKQKGRVRNENTQAFHIKVRHAMLKIVQKKQQIQQTKKMIRWVFTVL